MNLFNIKYPKAPITQISVIKIEQKYSEIGYVKHAANSSRPSIYDNVKFLLLNVAKNS